MTDNISEERIERACRHYCCGPRHCERENRTRFPQGCIAHKYADAAKAFLEADAPAIREARVGGLRIAMYCRGAIRRLITELTEGDEHG